MTIAKRRDNKSYYGEGIHPLCSAVTFKMYFLLQKFVDNVRGTKIFGPPTITYFTTSKCSPG